MERRAVEQFYHNVASTKAAILDFSDRLNGHICKLSAEMGSLTMKTYP